MASLQLGQPFPDFELSNYSTKQARASGPLLVFVWRTECPTCRLMLPFVDRLQTRHRTAHVLGIAQNDTAEIADYAKEHDISMKSLPDTNLRISRQLGVDIVPAYWLVSTEGKVLMTGTGWDRNEIEKMAQLMASSTSSAYAPLVTTADEAPVFKPG